MSRKTSLHDLTVGPLGKQIFIFSLPLIFSNLLQILFNMADIAVVGQFAGSSALGSVGSTTTLVALFTGFLIGIGSGINVQVAHCFGTKNKKDLEKSVHSCAIISLLFGILLLLIGVFGARLILSLLGTKEELIDGAVLYVQIYFLGMPALAIYNFGNAVFSAVGNTSKPLKYLSVAGAINIVFNLFFVIVCKMSVAGVALASIISQYISAVLILIALFRSKEDFGLKFKQIKLSKTQSLSAIKLGVPAGLQNAIFQLANLFVQLGVNKFDAIMVAGNSAAANADALVYDVMMAFYTACGSFMGQNFGAGKKDRVKKSYLICLAYSFGIGILMGGMILLFGNGFLGLFTRDPLVIEAGMKRLAIMCLGYAFSAFMDCSIAASRALGKGVIPTVIVIMGSCVFRIIWIYTVFAYFETILSLYLLYIFSWSLTGIAEIIYYRSVYKKQMKVLDAKMASCT